MEPENLLDNDSPNPQKIVETLLIGIVLYIVAVIVLFFTVYMGCLNLLEIGDPFLFLVWQMLLLTISFLLPGYFLQEKAFQLLNKSLVKSALVPVVVWLLVTSILLITDFNIVNVKYFLAAFAWLIPLCFLISWFISNRKTGLFVLLLIVHWLGSAALQMFF